MSELYRRIAAGEPVGLPVERGREGAREEERAEGWLDNAVANKTEVATALARIQVLEGALREPTTAMCEAAEQAEDEERGVSRGHGSRRFFTKLGLGAAGRAFLDKEKPL